jgi:cell division protein FtsB
VSVEQVTWSVFEVFLTWFIHYILSHQWFMINSLMTVYSVCYDVQSCTFKQSQEHVLLYKR